MRLLLLLVIFASFFILPSFGIETNSTASFSNSDYETYSLTYKHYEYYIPYKISDSRIQEMNLDCNSMGLLIHMQKTKEEKVVIGIPKDVLDVKPVSGEELGNDNVFIILVDGIEVEYTKNSTNDLRILEIPLSANDTTIEIISPYLLSSSYTHVCAMPDSDQSAYHSLLSPLKQFSSGILFDQIQCKDSLVLIQKYNDSPACVKPDSKTKLIERGWTRE